MARAPSVENVKQLILQLEATSADILQLGFQQNATLNELFGWQHPAMSPADLRTRIEDAIGALRGMQVSKVDEDASTRFGLLTGTLQTFRMQSLGNLQGNGQIVVAQLLQLLGTTERLAHQLQPAPPKSPEWDEIDEKLLPKKLLARLRSIEGHLRAVEPRVGLLNDKLATIEEAYESAERLPTDLATLSEGQREIAAIRDQVKAHASDIGVDATKSAEQRTAIEKHNAEAEALFDRLEKVYKAAATAGLARAFGARAKGLNWSLGVWVLLLILDLALGGYIGHQRFTATEAILSRPLPAATFWANLVFSLASLAAPIWFGWVATKQINQRFRLAEDYSFKATIATAYEGYRSEAARLDPAFEARLFGSALTRLEEQPLRFVENESYGTPWHELTSSPAFAKALDAVPELKATLAKVVAGTAAAAAGVGAAFGAGRTPSAASKDADGGEAS